MNWYFDEPLYLILLLLLPLFALAMFRFIKWKKHKKSLFAETKFQEKLFSSTGKSSKIIPILYLFAVLFLIISIADLLNGTEEVKTQQKMSNVIFLLDVSNSMNAEDIPANRLVQAKNIMLNTMSKMKDDKVGLIIFAGESTSLMPLTTDYAAAETYISGISTQMMKVQGTDFLKAINKSVEKFKNVPKGSRKIILLSDGEDNEGSESEAAKLAENEGINIISVGIGTVEGAPIPEYTYGQLMGYKTDFNGETVISKRQTEALENLAKNTGGEYIDGNNLEESTNQIIENLNKKNTSSGTWVKSQNAVHYYQYFLAISLFIFFVILLFNPKKDFNI
ncbi:vWA domain-containing protein [Frigoriflavimonas asaccharolytica]|uniref:Ca-activated chloride channel family protein n=1 Tax=Frigoriflavimonas asaccharolytica TaxID=2735899 RepID=A0A8J8G8G0_9FLAO|nr:VWA domain-containing protein [Frigoriflavimonas asaccharolytica]NRS92871.1 Ca-activated chloride channel family protein [Frigoriflavimonas asaccharolytica]